MDQPGTAPTGGETVRRIRSAGIFSSPGSSTVGEQTARPTVPDYELLQRIGSGAYGEVWLARSKATGALRAAKIVWRNKFEDDRPFRREFEGIQRFEQISREHPSQLALFHIGRNDPEGYFYYVMELADDAAAQRSDARPQALQHSANPTPQQSGSYIAHTLRADLGQGHLPAARVLEIGLTLTEALGHLHSHGLVHRDVKPSNVIFVKGRPKLADIGLVTDASDQCSIVGTEGYLPPEGPGTPQADIFALGKVLYEAATGLDRRELPKLPEDLRSWLDARQVFEINEIILKACASDPRARYASVEGMLADLRHLHGGKSVKRKRTLQGYGSAGKRAGLALAGLGALAAIVAALVRGIAPSDPYPEGPPSTSKEATGANMYCDKGFQILRADDVPEMPEAYTNFLNAIALDTNFARPYVGLMQMALREPPTALKPSTPRKTLELAAKRLKELAPRLGATSAAESIIHYYDGDFEAADRYAQQAIKANPNYELGYTWYAYMLAHWNRPDDALKELDESQKRAPSKAIIYGTLGNIYYARRDFTNAIKSYRTALEMDHRHHKAFFIFLGRALRATGDYTNSMDIHEEGALLDAPERARTNITNEYNNLRQAFAAGKEEGYWKQEEKLHKADKQNFYGRASIQIHLGNTDRALDLLSDSLKARENWGQERALNYLLFDEYWDPLHDNDRFKRLLDEAGFKKVMGSGKQ